MIDRPTNAPERPLCPECGCEMWVDHVYQEETCDHCDHHAARDWDDAAEARYEF